LEGSEHSRQLIYDYMPEVQRDAVESVLLAPGSLPANIKACHYWSATQVDDRRRERGMLLGVDGNTITGIRLRAHMLLGAGTVPLARQSFPKLARPKKPAVAPSASASASSSACPAALEEEPQVDSEDDADEIAIELASELGCKTRLYQGWRCSYRTIEAEQPSVQEPKVLVRLKKKMLKLKEMDRFIPESSGRHHYATSASRACTKQAHAFKAKVKAEADRDFRAAGLPEVV
jgi:hypothetical protein